MSAILMQWSDAFNTGIGEVDGQHKTLVDLLNRLNQAIVERKGSQACADVLGQLVGYTKVHFSLEEGMMKASRYPAFENHRKQHEELLAQVAAFQQKLAQGKGAITFELLHFLQMWLTKHINESDKRFGQYYLLFGPDQSDVASAAPAPTRPETASRAWWRFW
jgi:hemerythrin